MKKIVTLKLRLGGTTTSESDERFKLKCYVILIARDLG